MSAVAIAALAPAPRTRRGVPVETLPNAARSIDTQLPRLLADKSLMGLRPMADEVVLTGFDGSRESLDVREVNWRWVRVYRMNTGEMSPWVERGAPFLVDWGAHVFMDDHVTVELAGGALLTRRLRYLTATQLGLQRYCDLSIDWIDRASVRRLARCVEFQEWANTYGTGSEALTTATAGYSS